MGRKLSSILERVLTDTGLVNPIFLKIILREIFFKIQAKAVLTARSMIDKYFHAAERLELQLLLQFSASFYFSFENTLAYVMYYFRFRESILMSNI